MNDHIVIGSCPVNEDLVYLDTSDPQNYADMAKQCQRYIDCLRRVFGPEPTGARLVTMSFPHEFGQYCEVACKFDSNNEEAYDHALLMERNSPLTWDEPAREGVKEPVKAKPGKLLGPDDVGMSKSDLEAMMKQAVYDGVIETFCRKCGNYKEIEGDCDDAWCESCEDSTKFYNPLIEMGAI